MKSIQWEKVCFSDMQNLRNLLNTLTADGKYSLFNRDNLFQHLQMQLSQNQKNI